MKIACAFLVAGLMVVAPSWAQDPAANYPSRPVRWVIPFTPGASNDVIGRLVAGKLTDALASSSSSTTARGPAASSAPKRWRVQTPTATR